MLIRKWENLPPEMQTEEVRFYYDILSKRKFSLFLTRCFDIFASLLLLILLFPAFLILSIAIKIDSKGPAFYRQERYTKYGQKFRIFKFRTMVDRADQIGSAVTVDHDARITRVGKYIRKFRLDEFPQLINVLGGSMTFVGTRPEVPKYVDRYTKEMFATFLLPAGITSEASIHYKDEAQRLSAADDPDRVYVEEILPEKMKYNLRAIERFGFFRNLAVMIKTVFSVFRKSKSEEKEKVEKREPAWR